MSRTNPTTAEKIRSLPWLNAYSAMNSVFCQLTVFGAVFTLFLSHLALKKWQIGLVMSLMPLCSMLSLLTAPYVARAGFKRMFLTFWGSRNIAISSLLLTPWALASIGPSGTFYMIAAGVLLFAICRSIGETAWYPWSYEVIPPAIRGQFSAINSVICTLLTMVAIAAAGWVLHMGSGLDRYMWLFAGGIVIGLTSVATMSRMPGGAAIAPAAAKALSPRRFLSALGDRNFTYYLVGTGLMLLGNSLLSFVPLFLKESIGLREDQVVLAQSGGMIGVLLSFYLCGWAADRYGSKPVMMTGAAMLMVVPACWWVLPRHSPWSLWLALAAGLLAGLGNLAYGIGQNRKLYTDVVPHERRTEYFAIFCAWGGLTNGLGTLLAGPMVDLAKGFSGHLGPLTMDAYTPLLAGSTLLLALGGVVLAKTRADGEVSARQLAGMFLRGNPLAALTTKLRYNLTGEESSRVLLTERLSRTESPLSSDELIEGLFDPSFNVRQEAMFSIATMRPNFRLVQALWKVAEGDHPDSVAAAAHLPRMGRPRLRRSVRQLIEALADGNYNVRYEAVMGLARRRSEPAVVAALQEQVQRCDGELATAAVWALSRLGATEAAPVIREALNSPNPLLAGRAARALGTLGDSQSAPILLERLRTTQDIDLRVAYASALGALGVQEAAAEMLAMMPQLTQEVYRAEVALAAARIVGDEKRFLRLWRKSRRDAATSLSQALLGCQRPLRKAGLLAGLAVGLAERSAPGPAVGLVESLAAGPAAVAAPSAAPATTAAPAGTAARSVTARKPAETLEACVEALAREDWPRSAELLSGLMRGLPAGRLPAGLSELLPCCGGLLESPSPALRDCLVVSLHVFTAAVKTLGNKNR